MNLIPVGLEIFRVCKDLKELISEESKFRQFSSPKLVNVSVVNVVEEFLRVSCRDSGEILLQLSMCRSFRLLKVVICTNELPVSLLFPIIVSEDRSLRPYVSQVKVGSYNCPST